MKNIALYEIYTDSGFIGYVIYERQIIDDLRKSKIKNVRTHENTNQMYCDWLLDERNTRLNIVL